MSFSGNGGPVAALAAAYGDGPIDDVGDVPASSDATGGVPEHVPAAGAASQPDPAATPADATQTDDGTPETPASEEAKPFRVFASEADYRQHIGEETKRQREAQSASDRQARTLQAEIEALKRENIVLVQHRDEIYARAQTEDLTAPAILEAFVQRDSESVKQFEVRKAEAARTLAAEAQREDVGRIIQGASDNATKLLLAEKALDLGVEVGHVPGLNVKAALEKAIIESPEAQRYVADSYELMKRDPATGQAVPDIERRQRATERAYAIGYETVRKAAVAIQEAAKAREPKIAPATSIEAPATLGSERRRYSSPVEAIAAGYASR